MKIDLSGKNALITGGAGGIGRACAELLARAGARIVIADIDESGAQKVAADLGGEAVRCDLADPTDVQAMGDEVRSLVGHVDILINNTSIFSYKPGIGSISIDEWDQVLDVNLRGAFLVCREFVEGMKARGSGKIVNFSSLAARVGGIEAGMHYSVSKAGLIGLTRTLAKEVGPYGVNVNAIAPGIITTDPVARQIAGREESYTAQIPLRRLGRPEDVARVVLFLASPLSDYVTGVVLDINGGLYLG
ncbi:MAG TPA: SDR family oxidoreductase [Chloroflexi bacterium]|nr:SDR family oxidoreductase [Chloroflexota bacterium]